MSKKTQIAKLILSSKVATSEMAADIVDMQSNSADDNISPYHLDSKKSVIRLLREWAKGLGGME